MKILNTLFLLAMIPTFLFSSDLKKNELYGFWYDNYSDTKLEIKHTRKGIKVKHHSGWLNKWNTYLYMGRGVYDDCDGRVIIARGYDQIEWRKGRRRSIILSRYNDYNRYDRNNSYDRYRDSDRYRDDRDYYSRRYSDTRYGGFNRDEFCGDWYCEDRGLSLSIQAYGNGFRARFDDHNAYYEPYKDHFRDRRGNRYYFEDNWLTWRSSDNKRKLRFRKR